MEILGTILGFFGLCAVIAFAIIVVRSMVRNTRLWVIWVGGIFFVVVLLPGLMLLLYRLTSSRQSFR